VEIPHPDNWKQQTGFARAKIGGKVWYICYRHLWTLYCIVGVKDD
jgi:hypothetical protein